MKKEVSKDGVGIRLEFVFVGSVRSVEAVISEEGLKDKDTREVVLKSLKDAADDLLTKHYGNT